MTKTELQVELAGVLTEEGDGPGDYKVIPTDMSFEIHFNAHLDDEADHE